MGENLQSLITIADYEHALKEFRRALVGGRLGLDGVNVTMAIEAALVARITEQRLAAAGRAALKEDGG